MRSALLLAGAALCAAGTADRLILTPMGSNLPIGTARAEYLRHPDLSDTLFLEAGVLETVEAGIRIRDGEDPALDLNYNYIFPIIDLSPGISAGVLDALDTAEGRAFFAAVTFRYGNWGDLNMEEATIFTMGLWSDRSSTGFVSISLPLSSQVRLLGEGYGRTVNTGVEYRPDPSLAGRMLWLDGKPSWSLSYKLTF